jgi:hypothetical protein
VAIAAALAPGVRPLARLAPACTWHAWTGIPCPGCGTTRAIVDLVGGDFRGAFAINPLATAGLLAFALGGVAAPVWLRLGGAVPVPEPGPKPGWLAAAALLILANWGWLVASGV